MCLASRLVGPICLAVHVRALSLCRPSRLDSHFMSTAPLFFSRSLLQLIVSGIVLEKSQHSVSFLCVRVSDCEQLTLHYKFRQKMKKVSWHETWEKVKWSEASSLNLVQLAGILIPVLGGNLGKYVIVSIFWFSIHNNSALFTLLLTSGLFVVFSITSFHCVLHSQMSANVRQDWYRCCFGSSFSDFQGQKYFHIGQIMPPF